MLKQDDMLKNHHAGRFIASFLLLKGNSTTEKALIKTLKQENNGRGVLMVD